MRTGTPLTRAIALPPTGRTLAKLMNNNTVAQLEAIFDFEDMDELFGIAKTKKKDTNKKKAYYVAYLIICLKHNCGADMPGWKLIPNELQ